MKKSSLLFVLIFIVLQSIHAQVNLTQGLVGHWNFIGNANDVSGNNNNGTVNGANLTFDKAGNPNSAYYFNGVSDFIEVANSASLNFSSTNDSFTLYALVKPQGYNQGTCHGNSIIEKSNTDFANGYGIRFSDAPFTVNQNCVIPVPDTAHHNFQLHRNNNTTAFVNAYTPYVVTNTWFCLVATNTADTVKFYINGALVYTNAGDGNLSNSPSNLFFGKKNWASYPYHYNGVIDEIRIYNRVINTDEIDSLCNVPQIFDTVSANFNHSYPQVCDSTFVQFNDLSFAINSTITNWNWDFGDGNTSTLQNPTHNYSTAGNYLVRLIVTNNFSHNDTFTLNVIAINNAPNVTAIANPTQVCAGQPTTLTAAGAQSYVWTGSVINGVPFVPTSSNSYIVIGTDAKGCTNSAVVSIVVVPPIQITVIPANPLLCLGDSIQLIASGASTYTWLPNYALNTVTGNSVWAKPTTSTIYTITGTDNGCEGTKTVLVDVITDPKLILSKSNDVNCDNKTIQLSVSGATDYSWSPSNLCSTPLSNTTNATINKTTTFTVIGKVGNCESIDSITVNYYNNSESGIFIPNAFSPNGDGKNDCWGVQAFGNYKSYFLTIYNRWGMPVFESTNPADCWNGNYRREKQNVDTYFYYLEAETECGNILRKGDILLIR
ncbi:MAG: gliding motility-associated C-terminal domain-containing protein [Chitinophagaceae bacterium]|nr:gliding motility-associated C-terminal domain-containing protein [Chitinophagaceae bacterium]